MLPYANVTLEQVGIELGRVGVISLNDPDVRSLAGVFSGPISFEDLKGKQLEEEETVVIRVHKVSRLGTAENTSPTLKYEVYEIGG